MERRLQKLTLLVTGAGGFIGSRLVRSLVGQGATVRALVGALGDQTRALPATVLGAHADITNREVLRDLAQGASVVVHLAGPPTVAASFTEPLEFARVHTLGTLTLLDVCREVGIQHLVYVSSAEIYGRPAADVAHETLLYQPRSPYAAAKAAAEQFVLSYHAAFGLNAVILRPFSVYGPGLRMQSVLGTILTQIREGEEIVLADLSPVRDYCYLDDVVAGIVLASTRHQAGISIFNLGTGIGTSVEQLARCACEISGRNVPVREDPSRRRPNRADIDRLIADPTHAATTLRWQPTISLATGIRQTLQWLEGNPCTNGF